MKLNEHYLAIVAEEAAEIAREAFDLNTRASKALRFGLDEVQEGQLLSNAEHRVETTIMTARVAFSRMF